MFDTFMESARDAIGRAQHEARGMGHGAVQVEHLLSADRFGMGEPGTGHMLVVLLARGAGGASEILRALGVDPGRVRFEMKKRAWPASAPGPNLRRTRGQLRGTIRQDLDELDFGD